MTILEHLDDVFDFGKFRGCSVGEVLMSNPSYLKWVAANVHSANCIVENVLLDEIRAVFPDFIITEDFETNVILKRCEYEQLEQELEENQCGWDDEPYDRWDDGSHDTYGRYSGSYAQDEMGYSDDDIDTIFDGDPSAYWNID